MKFSLALASTTLLQANSLSIQKLGSNNNHNPKALIAQYPGLCPNVTGTSNFSQGPYIANNWWTIATSPFFWYTEETACSTATYKLSENFPGYIDVFNSGLAPPENDQNSNSSFDNWTRYGSNGTAIVVPNMTGTLSVTFPYPRLADPNDPNYIILATDNESYSYVWSCDQKQPNRFRPILWILNRDQNLSATLVRQQAAYAIDLLEYKFGWSDAKKFGEKMFTLQTKGCPAVPDFTEPEM